jgi:RimJ/RimL family protein N-acetyltransferase
MASRDPDREGVFAVDLGAEGYAGSVGLHPTNDVATELGYWLGRPYWGAGLMTEAVRAVTDWAAASWRRRALVAGHFTDNPASGAVLVKAGFLYTGVVEAKFSVARGEDAHSRQMIWLA